MSDAGERVDVGVVRYVQWSTLAAPSSTARRTPGPAPSWLPCTRRPSPRRAAGRQHRARLVVVERAGLAEHVDPAHVRGDGVEHRAAHEVDVLVGVVAPAGTRCAPRKVTSSATRPRRSAPTRARRPRSARSRSWSPGSSCPARRPRRRGGAARAASSSSVAARVAVDRRPDAARRVRPAGHPRVELRAPVAGEDQVACGCRPSRAAPRGRRRRPRSSAAGASPAGPDPGHPVAVDDQRGVGQPVRPRRG